MTTELAVPLDQRVEFASADWIHEANRFLSERRESIKHFARPISFSVEFDKAPEHLNSSGKLGYGSTFSNVPTTTFWGHIISGFCSTSRAFCHCAPFLHVMMAAIWLFACDDGIVVADDIRLGHSVGHLWGTLRSNPRAFPHCSPFSHALMAAL